MHVGAITRWTTAWGFCLHIHWSNHQVSAGYFPPLTQHVSHTMLAAYVLHSQKWWTGCRNTRRSLNRELQLFNILRSGNRNDVNTSGSNTLLEMEGFFSDYSQHLRAWPWHVPMYHFSKAGKLCNGWVGFPLVRMNWLSVSSPFSFFPRGSCCNTSHRLQWADE